MIKFLTSLQEARFSSPQSVHQWRESFLRVIMLASVILAPITFAGVYIESSSNRVLIGIYAGVYLILLAATFLRLSFRIRANVFLFLCMSVGINNLFTEGIDSGPARLFLLSMVMLSGLLLTSRDAIYAFGLSLGAILFAGWLTLNGYIPSPAGEGITKWLSGIGTYILLGGIIVVALTLFQAEFDRAQELAREAIGGLEAERAHLEDKAASRTQEFEHKSSRLRASTSIARLAVQVADVNELMETIVTLTEERFLLNHAGLFLLDERKKTAFLVAASSAKGKAMIANGYSLDVDSRSAISLVVEEGKFLVTSGDAESKLARDPDFPSTRSRLVLPLSARGSIIGILDLQSEQEQAFDTEDAEIFQSLADLVAVLIENTRLLNETQALVEQLETLTSYQSQEAWHKFAARRVPAYQYTPSGVRPLLGSLTKTDGGLKVALSLHGQAIGSMTFRRKDQASAWSVRERELLEKIAEQVALALDNSRLVEEAQRNAQRDQLIASVSSRVRESLDMDSVVKTAASELQRVFDLKEAEVSLAGLTLSSESPIERKRTRRAGTG